jgi:hypothetical protein
MMVASPSGNKCSRKVSDLDSRALCRRNRRSWWIESLFGHVKAEYPHLLAIRDPATLRAELAWIREHHNSVRLHAGIGYVTPNDEHDGRGEAIRKAREAGLEQARLRRIAYHRAQQHPDPVRPEHDPSEEPGDVG